MGSFCGSNALKLQQYLGGSICSNCDFLFWISSAPVTLGSVYNHLKLKRHDNQQHCYFQTKKYSAGQRLPKGRWCQRSTRSCKFATYATDSTHHLRPPDHAVYMSSKRLRFLPLLEFSSQLSSKTTEPLGHASFLISWTMSHPSDLQLTLVVIVLVACSWRGLRNVLPML